MTELENKEINKLAARLRFLRTEKGFSQETFVYETSLDRTYISGLERGKRNPSYITLLKLAETLKISVSELLDF